MPPPILIWEEIQAKQHRRERVKDYFQLRIRTDNSKPNDAEVKDCSDLRDRSDAAKHDWVDAKAVGIPFVLSMKVAIDAAGILVGNPLEWLVLLVG